MAGRARAFGMEPEARPSVALAGEGLPLRYRWRAACPAEAAPNVLLVIDSLRADALART